MQSASKKSCLKLYFSVNVVSVKFAESSYDILEGGTVTLCVEISGLLEKEVHMDISTIADEAQG